MALSARNQRYKDRILSAPYEICIERARAYTESYKQTEGKDPVLRAALAFRHTCKTVTVLIDEDERIAGNRSSKTVGAVLPVERGDINLILDLELDALAARKKDPYHIDPANRRELFEEILPYWKTRTLRYLKKPMWRKAGLRILPSVSPASIVDRLRALDIKKLQSFFPEQRFGPGALIREIGELLYTNIGLLNNAFDTQGHLILGHRHVLEVGFRGLATQAKAQRKIARDSGDTQGEAFLAAVEITCDAIRIFADRVADQAIRMTANEPNPDRRRELVEIAVRARRVPYDPPRDFKEAVQALWLTQVGAFLSYGMAGIFAVGRIDQYLNRFYEADLAAGRITPEDAQEWIEELLLKLSSNLLLLPVLGKNTGNELGADSCSPTIGGIDENGNDAVNKLTYLFLGAYENVRSTGNSFMVRLSEKNPPDYWNRVMGSYRFTSGAALFNDEVIVDALRKNGVSLEDARNYGLVGCVEPTSDGNTFGCTSGNDVSLTAALEMTLLRGKLRILGRRIGPKTADPRTFETFEDFFSAYKQQLSFLISRVANAVNIKDTVYRDHFPNPYISATIESCIDNHRDMTAGGAKYNFASIGARGFGTTIDSLAAIREMVFDTRRISMGRLLELLERNFEGNETERQRLLNSTAKFGQDNDSADALAVELAKVFCDEVTAQKSIRGGVFRPGFFSYGMHVYDGLLLGATPNGRKACEPVSNSFSPSNGAELNGPIGVLRSVAKIDGSEIGNGCALNIKFLPSLFDGEERLAKMVALIRAYFAEGGMELSPNVVSNEILRDAQLNPEHYRDLVVRVSGYSAYFTNLGKPLQDEIISRTEFQKV